MTKNQFIGWISGAIVATIIASVLSLDTTQTTGVAFVACLIGIAIGSRK